MLLINDCSAPVVDGLAQDAEVVGVAHAVHESHRLPVRHQARRARTHLLQERLVPVLPACTCAARTTPV